MEVWNGLKSCERDSEKGQKKGFRKTVKKTKFLRKKKEKNKKKYNMKKAVLCLLLALMGLAVDAQETSVAGFYPLGSGRIVYNFNPGWRFHLGDVKDAEATTFDDSRWEVVSAPHTSRLEPAEVSGCRNYQGVTWYRKTFIMPDEMAGKQVEVHFEAIMGKQLIYVNGRLVRQNFGGYLPITVNLSQEDVKPGDKCIIAVRADNSDDKRLSAGKETDAARLRLPRWHVSRCMAHREVGRQHHGCP